MKLPIILKIFLITSTYALISLGRSPAVEPGIEVDTSYAENSEQSQVYFDFTNPQNPQNDTVSERPKPFEGSVQISTFSLVFFLIFALTPTILLIYLNNAIRRKEAEVEEVQPSVAKAQLKVVENNETQTQDDDIKKAS